MKSGGDASRGADHVMLGYYLLGLLSEKQMEDVETHLFTCRDTRELVEEAEHRLIAAYVQDSLSDTERRAFETHFLRSRENWIDTQIALALAEHPPSRHSAWGQLAGWTIVQPLLTWGMAGSLAVLLIVSCVLWLSLRQENNLLHSLEVQLTVATGKSADLQRELQAREPLRSLSDAQAQRWPRQDPSEMGKAEKGQLPEPLQVVFDPDHRIQVRLVPVPFDLDGASIRNQALRAVLRHDKGAISRQTELEPINLGGVWYAVIILVADDLAPYIGRSVTLELTREQTQYRRIIVINLVKYQRPKA